MKRVPFILLLLVATVISASGGSDSINIRNVGNLTLPGTGYQAEVSGNYAYIAADTGLYVADISTYQLPILVGMCTAPGAGRGIAVRNGWLYLADGNAGMRIMSLTDPANPVEVSSVDTIGWTSGVDVQDTLACLACSTGLWTINITDQSHPVVQGRCDPGWNANTVAISGQYAYVAGDSSGLRIVDISNPVDPLEIGHYPTTGATKGVAVLDTLVYLADGTGGLIIINAADPFQPVWVATFMTGGDVNGVTVRGGLAYISDQIVTLYIVDITDPVHPMFAGFYTTYYPRSFPKSVTFADGYIFMPCTIPGFKIFQGYGPAGLSGGESPGQPLRPLRFDPVHPNPCSGVAQLRYVLSTAGVVEVAVYNITGALVTRLINGQQNMGGHEISWNGRNHDGRLVPPGTYFCRVSHKGIAVTQKIIIIR